MCIYEVEKYKSNFLKKDVFYGGGEIIVWYWRIRFFLFIKENFDFIFLSVIYLKVLWYCKKFKSYESI